MSECKKLLIFGATGLVGRHIVQQILTGKDAFDRIAIFTSPDTVNSKSEEIESLKNQGVEVIVGQITDENDVRKAFQGEFHEVGLDLQEPYQGDQLLMDENRHRYSHLCCWEEYDPASN